MDQRLTGVFTAMPGRVESYDAAKQSCDVQPLVQNGYINEEGERVAERLPVVPGIPVVFPGSGAWSFTFPISRGDTVLLVFANCSLDQWLERDGEVDPIDDRRHHLSDAFAIPGLRSFRNPLDEPPSDAMVLTGNEVRLGDVDASKGVAREDDTVGLRSALGITLLETLLDTRYAIANPLSHLVDTAIGYISSASSKVKASD